MKIKDNPFMRWRLNPQDDQRRLTITMRRRVRQLSDDERQALREDWRALMDDPLLRARWILLTPPLPQGQYEERSPWELAKELLEVAVDAPALPELEPTLEDGLILPSLLESRLDAAPPFLPALLGASGEAGQENS